MHNKKYNNKTSNFIQGLRPFSNSIPRGLKKIFKKRGYNFSHIIDNWTKIVGKDISDACYPNSVKIGKDMNNGTLILSVIHGKELEVEYSKMQIIDKINSFFGYNYIVQIKLKIINKKIIRKENSKKVEIMNKKFDNKLGSLQDPALKDSLSKLIRAFNEKNN